MNRRQFLKLAGSTLAIATIAPKRLIRNDTQPFPMHAALTLSTGIAFGKMPDAFVLANYLSKKYGAPDGN